MKLLLAEDDAALADALVTQLQNAGFDVEHAPNGAVADFLLVRHPPDIAILDLGLPMMDGLSVLKQVRKSQPSLPVLLLTAKDSLDDRVAGLQAGADDYVTKPFDFPELLARLHALLRRSQAHTKPESWGGLTMDAGSRKAQVGDVSLDLSGREWRLLELLVERREQVLTKDQITQAWHDDGGDIGSGNSIEVYIHKLRRKLEGSGLQIRTVRGLGYLMEVDD